MECDSCGQRFRSARGHKRHLAMTPIGCLEQLKRSKTSPPRARTPRDNLGHVDEGVIVRQERALASDLCEACDCDSHYHEGSGTVPIASDDIFVADAVQLNPSQCDGWGSSVNDAGVVRGVSHCKNHEEHAPHDHVDDSSSSASDTASQCSETLSADDLPAEPEHPSKSVPRVSLVWPNINYETMSRLCNCLHLSDRDCELLFEEIRLLDVSLPIPNNVRDLRQAEARAFAEARYSVTAIPVDVPQTKSGHVMTEEQSLFLVHANVIEAMEKLLAIPEHAPWTVWQPTNPTVPVPESEDPTCEEWVINELNTGLWWLHEHEKLPGTNPSMLVIILNCDETPVTMTGRKVFPVYATCGNIHRWYRQKQSGWALIGFIPVVRPIKAFKDSVRVRTYRRLVKRWCMGMLLKPVLDNANGLLIKCLGKNTSVIDMWVYPRFCFLIADEPEIMHAAVGGYGSTKSHMPCSNCDVVPSVQGLTTSGNARDIQDIIQFMCPVTQTSSMTTATSKRLSVHREFSWMPFVPGYNPFRNPPDRMHQFDHGVFVLVKDLILACIKMAYSADTLSLFDRRWSWLARLPGTKIFRRGVSSLSFVACFENRIMGMGLPFVLRAIEGRMLDTYKNILHKRCLEDLAMSYMCFRWLLNCDSFTSSMLVHLRTLGHQLQAKINALNMIVHGHEINAGIKFHKILHWADYIIAYGATGNWNTETFESAHKILKQWKTCLSFNKGSSAAVKLMRQMTVRDGHVDGHAKDTIDSVLTRKGWGPGGFRGRLSLQDSRGLTARTMRALIELETCEGFGQLSVEELHCAYTDILPSHCHDVAFLSTILSKSACCLDCMATPPSSSSATVDSYALTFFDKTKNNYVQLWKKTFSASAEAYVSLNCDVFYSTNSTNDEHVGRVRWICSMRNLKQFVVIQRMAESTLPCQGVTLQQRLAFVTGLDHSLKLDVARCHCRRFTLMNPSLVTSFDVIQLSDGPWSTTIAGIVMLQPDFLEDVPETDEHTRFFSMPYIIQ